MSVIQIYLNDWNLVSLNCSQCDYERHIVHATQRSTGCSYLLNVQVKDADFIMEDVLSALSNIVEHNRDHYARLKDPDVSCLLALNLVTDGVPKLALVYRNDAASHREFAQSLEADLVLALHIVPRPDTHTPETALVYYAEKYIRQLPILNNEVMDLIAEHLPNYIQTQEAEQ